MADEIDAKVLTLVVETAVFMDVCGDQFPVSKADLDKAFAGWVVLRLPIPGLADVLRRDSAERRAMEAAIGPYFKRIPGHEKEIECSGRYKMLVQSRPTLEGDAAEVPKDVLDRYGPPGRTAVAVVAKERTVPIPPQRPPYFISLDTAYGQKADLRVVMGNHAFRGPNSSYGPTTEVLPREMTVTWRYADGEEKTRTLDLSRGVPAAFDQVRIKLNGGDPLVLFEVKDRGRESRIPYGETPEQATKRQFSEALWLAANFGRLEEVKDLLEKGADIDYALDDINPSVLRVAFNARKLEVVDCLLSRGAKMRKPDWREPLLAERAVAAGQAKPAP
ncbi:ankyrin repeat domain-containing protein [Usitatibacter rugosus]|nr:ankyrin repeat domain-containing protein [Usitatibacter rugosus]